ncbi:hypothetical protein SCLCIDRAFT_1225431, partial [Scleroderma citrinum Foug A]
LVQLRTVTVTKQTRRVAVFHRAFDLPPAEMALNQTLNVIQTVSSSVTKTAWCQLRSNSRCFILI